MIFKKLILLHLQGYHKAKCSVSPFHGMDKFRRLGEHHKILGFHEQTEQGREPPETLEDGEK